MEVKAVYSMGLFGINIFDIEYGIEDYVTWSWSNETRQHRTKIYNTIKDGRAYFCAMRLRVYLDECIKV